ACARHDSLDVCPLYIPICERRKRGVKVCGHAVVVDRARKCFTGFVADIARRGSDGLAQRTLWQEPGENKSDAADGSGEEKHRVQRTGESLLVRRACFRWKPEQRLDTHSARDARPHLGRQQMSEIRTEPRREQSAENRGAEGAADQSKKRSAGCRDAE